MVATSGTYNFQSIETELIIRESFERIGIPGELIDPLKLESARRGINFILLEWMSKSVNLWTLQYEYLPLKPNKGQYELPNTLSNILEANLVTFTRQLGGTALSSAGNAAFAFDDNPLTSFQADWIGYDYGADTAQLINLVGLLPNNNTTDDPVGAILEASNDNVDWSAVYEFPLLSFTPGVIQWFNITEPVLARALRVRHIAGGEIDLQELYFNNNVQEFQISPLSRSEYFSLPNKRLAGRPTSFYLDRQSSAPILNIWPVPTTSYNCLRYSYKRMMQDVGQLTNTIEIPARFYPALVAALSYNLAVKYAPQAAQLMKAEYESSFALATQEDSETTPIRIYPDYYGGYYQ